MDTPLEAMAVDGEVAGEVATEDTEDMADMADMVAIPLGSCVQRS